MDHFEELKKHEFETVEELVEAGVLYKIVNKKDKSELIQFIKLVIKRGHFYIPTDLKTTENGNIYVPLTLRSLKGYVNQWKKETEKLKPLSTCTETTGNIPPELQTDEAKRIFDKALELNLYSVENDIYTWKETKSLLAYFADLTSEYLKLGKGIYDEKVKTSWKPFETLFRIKGLAQAKKDYQRTGTLPVGHDIIEKIFN